jgi:hypothetical protein
VTAAEGDYKEETVGEGDYVGEAVEGGDYVGEAVEGRAEAPSDPGPFSEDVSMDDFLFRPRLGSVLFLTFSDAAGDEVIFVICWNTGLKWWKFSISPVHCSCKRCVYTYSFMFCFP